MVFITCGFAEFINGTLRATFGCKACCACCYVKGDQSQEHQSTAYITIAVNSREGVKSSMYQQHNEMRMVTANPNNKKLDTISHSFPNFKKQVENFYNGE